jgi:hypothetical protein
MKKFVFIIAVAALAIPLMVGSGFAANKTIVYSDADKDLSTATLDCTISLSKGVSLQYNGLAQSYGMATGHMSGNKIYGTAYDTTIIHWMNSSDPDGGDLTGLNATDSSGYTGGSWTEM